MMLSNLLEFVVKHEKLFRGRKYAEITITQNEKLKLKKTFTNPEINQFVDEAKGKVISKGILWELACQIINSYPSLETFQKIKLICIAPYAGITPNYELNINYADIMKLIKECENLRRKLS